MRKTFRLLDGTYTINDPRTGTSDEARFYDREELRRSIRKGIKWLDERVENWHLLVDIDELDMQSYTNDILGQLAPLLAVNHENPDYFDVLVEHGLGFGGNNSVYVLGFSTTQDVMYPVLTDVWKREIIKRRNA